MQWVELLCYAVCKVDEDCKLNNTKCDQQDYICKPSCTKHEDCNSIPCDTVKGVCDPSKDLILTMDIRFYAEQYLAIECNSDEDCKGENNKCDLQSKICRIICTVKGDCKGFEKVCDVDRGFCMRGKIVKLRSVRVAHYSKEH